MIIMNISVAAIVAFFALSKKHAAYEMDS